MSRDSGLTVPQLLCMRAISQAEVEDCTLALVADEVHLSRSTVSAIIERLVKAGLVRRDRSTRDRRRLKLSLTAAGEQLLGTTPRPLQDRFLSRFAGLPLERQRLLLEAIEEVVEMMDAQELDAAPILMPGVEVRETKKD